MKSQRQPKKKPKPFFFIFFIVEFRKGCAIYRFPRFVGMVEWKKMNKKGVLGLWFGFGFGFGLGLGLGLVLVSMPDFRLLGGSICAVQRGPLSRKFPPPSQSGPLRALDPSVYRLERALRFARARPPPPRGSFRRPSNSPPSLQTVVSCGCLRARIFGSLHECEFGLGIGESKDRRISIKNNGAVKPETAIRVDSDFETRH